MASGGPGVTDNEHCGYDGDDDDADRVGKCHGYDGYIRVKKLASWGKKFGRPK